MSTRSRIAKQTGDNKFKSIYCHYDGYFDGVGEELKDFYTDSKKVDDLIALGDISSLDHEVAPAEGQEHSFDNRAEGVTTAYGRDRGEKGCRPVNSNSFQDLLDLSLDCGAEYLYVYDKDNNWTGYDLFSGRDWNGNKYDGKNFYDKYPEMSKFMEDLNMKESGGFFGKVKDYLNETDLSVYETKLKAAKGLKDIQKVVAEMFHDESIDDRDYNDFIDDDVTKRMNELGIVTDASVVRNAVYNEDVTDYLGWGMEIQPASENDIWLKFNLTYEYGVAVAGSAKVFMEGSDFGIKEYPQISKLMYGGGDECNYDRGWDKKPEDKEMFDYICKELVAYRNEHPYDIVESELNESKTDDLEESQKLKESFWDPGKYFQLLQDEVEIDADKWNSSNQEERDAMVKPQLEKFWNKYKNEMTQADFDALLEDMEDSNYHTEYRILAEIVNKEFANGFDFKESCKKDIKESDSSSDSEIVSIMQKYINEAIDQHNNAGGDITFSLVDYDPETNKIILSAYAIGQDGKELEREVEIQPLGITVFAIYDAIEDWASDHNSPDNFYEADEKLRDKTSRTNPKKYTLNTADSNKISELENGSAFTWEGMDISDDNLKAIVEFLEKETPNIKLPVFFYTWKGKEFNEKYGLTGDNAYPDDLTFLSIPLDNWEGMGKVPFVKMQVGARWLDDIVDNNARRQGGE